MGFTEALAERVSAKSALILIPSLLLAYVIVAVVVRPAWQEIKLARMPGARAPRIKAKLPLCEQTVLAAALRMLRPQILW